MRKVIPALDANLVQSLWGQTNTNAKAVGGGKKPHKKSVDYTHRDILRRWLHAPASSTSVVNAPNL